MKENKSGIKKLLVVILAIAVLIGCLFLFKSCNKTNTNNVETISNNNIQESTIVDVIEEPSTKEETTEIVEETKEEDIKEEIDVTTLYYWVNFINSDGATLQRSTYKYGTTPSYSGNTPTYYDGVYNYSFKGWDKKISTVYGTQTYTALYDVAGNVDNGSSKKTSTSNYLTFINVYDYKDNPLSTIKFSSNFSGNLEYKASSSGVMIEGKQASIEWDTYNQGDIILLIKTGDYVMFRGTDFATNGESVLMSGLVAASGDVTSLLNGVGGDVDLSSYEGVFKNMFNGCDSLTTAPSLPSTKLSNVCYYHMFDGCASLKAAPNLPAKNLTYGCYSNMFKDCQELETLPTISAETLAISCYNSMFCNCAKLTTIPDNYLPLTNLEAYCYAYMFRSCISLTTAPALLATTLADYCYSNMFNGCTSLLISEGDPGNYTKGAILTGSSSNCDNMFTDCKSTGFTGSPIDTNKTYYWYN